MTFFVYYYKICGTRGYHGKGEDVRMRAISRNLVAAYAAIYAAITVLRSQPQTPQDRPATAALPLPERLKIFRLVMNDFSFSRLEFIHGDERDLVFRELRTQIHWAWRARQQQLAGETIVPPPPFRPGCAG